MQVGRVCRNIVALIANEPRIAKQLLASSDAYGDVEDSILNGPYGSETNLCHVLKVGHADLGRERSADVALRRLRV
jgi:hypothetical protein